MNDHEREVGRNIRDRIVEVLELIADEAAQRRYQAGAPYVQVPSEMFNQWDDWYHGDGESNRPFMSAAEFEAVQTFARVLEQVAAEVPQHPPPLDEFIRTDAWRRLWTAARVALRAFGREWA